MKIISRSTRYNRDVYVVELDEGDVNKSNYDLIRECDGWAKAPFGGAVRRINDKTAEVSVYTD
jgi:hypothetical protein